MRRRWIALAIALSISGCADPSADRPNSWPSATAAITTPTWSRTTRTAPTTLEAFIEQERLDWLEDKRPPAEFKPPPAYRGRIPGSWVAASGQAAVADAMRRYCDGPRECEFAVMLGDNIYPDGATAGADGRDDARAFRRMSCTSLMRRSPPFSEEFRIYVALGNHDWRTSREGAMAQVRFHETTRPFYMDGIRYRVAPTGDARELEVFVLDTHVLLSGVTVLEDELADDGSELHTEEVDPPSPWSLPQTEDRARHGGLAREEPRAVAGALEDRHRAPPDLVLGRQQVPAGAGAPRPDPAGALPPRRPLPGGT